MVGKKQFFKIQRHICTCYVAIFAETQYVEKHFRRVLQGIKYRHGGKIRIKANQKLCIRKIRDI